MIMEEKRNQVIAENKSYADEIKLRPAAQTSARSFKK